MSRRAEREAVLRARVLEIRRTEPELTARQVAERVGVTKATVEKWTSQARKETK